MRSRPSLTLLSATLFAVLVFAAAPAFAQAPPADAPAAIAVVDSDFDPQIVIVLVGQTVAWTNQGSLAHDVTSIDRLFNSTGGPGKMDAGDRFEFAFTAPGVYDYYCTLHGTSARTGMWGRVVVTEPPVLQPAGAAGINPSKVGVNWLAHWVGIISFIAVFAVLVIYYFVLKYGETVHATDHRDRKEN